MIYLENSNYTSEYSRMNFLSKKYNTLKAKYLQEHKFLPSKEE